MKIWRRWNPSVFKPFRSLYLKYTCQTIPSYWELKMRNHSGRQGGLSSKLFHQKFGIGATPKIGNYLAQYHNYVWRAVNRQPGFCWKNSYRSCRFINFLDFLNFLKILNFNSSYCYFLICLADATFRFSYFFLDLIAPD